MFVFIMGTRITDLGYINGYKFIMVILIEHINFLQTTWNLEVRIVIFRQKVEVDMGKL